MCVSDLADVRRFDTSALALTEGHIHGKLDGQTRHCSSGQGLDLGHRLNQSGFGAVCLQRHLRLHDSEVGNIKYFDKLIKEPFGGGGGWRRPVPRS